MKVLMIVLLVIGITCLQMFVEWATVDVFFSYTKNATVVEYAVLIVIAGLFFAATQMLRRKSSVSHDEYHSLLMRWIGLTLMSEVFYLLYKCTDVFYSYGKDELTAALPGVLVIALVLAILYACTFAYMRRRQRTLLPQ